MMKNGTILKACRERKGWSQEELAHELQISQSDISKFENNVKEPVMSMLKKWATVTQSQDVLVAYMMGVEGITIMANLLTTMGTPLVGVIMAVGGIG